ncbi:response regulator [Paenibacillus sp. GCM10012307]|uniref:Response regulator n=1 Tax=Paenibacillus roseus TaxID=2798579 RepID=A0A934MR49_9BACL|nr:response regulator [Paenibacillus roseus]MBJ6362543.1 response regulator [Paenibacillus roseus]
MKVLIVDDEPLVRIGIKSAINWEEQGILAVEEAEDGEEALHKIMTDRPDVVLLDIKMPKLDGIEVLRELKQRNIATKVIVLSSFDDISYVKEALRLGAYDYCHKPDINERELSAILGSIGKQSAASDQSNIIVPKGATLKDQSLHNALHGNSSHLADTSLRQGNLYVVLFAVKDYETVIKRYTEHTESVLGNTIKNMISELFSKEKELEYLQLDEQRGVIFISNSNLKSLLASLTRVNSVLQMVNSTLKRFVNIELVFGISDWFTDFDGIQNGYQQAQTALSFKFYHPESHFFYYQHIRRKQQNKSAVEQSDQSVSQMKGALREGSGDKFLQLLGRWEQLLEKEECLTEQETKKIYEGFYFMMAESGKDSEEQAEALHTFAELSTYYRQLFQRLLPGKTNEYSQLVRSIIQYISEHYHESLSLKQLGEQFHLSPNYLSRMFKQDVGKGMFEYINEVRIEKAKELLKDYQYKIYDVAEMVGFSNQAHFAIVFQKYTGVPPKQFRKE